MVNTHGATTGDRRDQSVAEVLRKRRARTTEQRRRQHVVPALEHGQYELFTSA